ncbi:MAG TPA: hypothetical protein ENN22_05790 [bacterium]|nr:hypothetical protein [bacterium]
MTKKEFFKSVCNGKIDVLQLLLDLLSKLKIDYCVIGGLAVNAYTEPVVSLDLDIVITADNIDKLCDSASDYFKIERFEHSINLNNKDSDLRIQIQTDSRYQDFIGRATVCSILGYEMKVAHIEDVLKGKIWAYLDQQRRKSKRQKDLADIIRIIESFPSLTKELPPEVMKKIEAA